ncbi:MAG: hypothetical protein CL840_00175 [Crocinitomicaceae bacterium]|nr:hypothetical protein [Crocinitomicaceae bacterium]|tara:strand:- start:245 stop:1303 length:1059 start_codon:yes stop_codon:yes gene_type:complete
MSKTLKYARNGALIFGIGNGLLNIFKQLDKIGNEPNLKFGWKKLAGATLKGAAFGGVSGLAIGSIADYQNSLEEPINTDAYLLSIIDKVRLDKNNRKYKSLDEKADRLIYLLKGKLGNKLSGEPMRLGSTEHGTALANNFDIDICLPFKPDSFASTAQMYLHLQDSLEQLMGRQSFIRTRGQKKSIGVLLELRGEERRIDFVPFKLTASKSSNTTSGYLYVNDSVNPTYTKTDIQALNSLRLTETQKKIVVALKHWKTKHRIPLNSHLLQNLVLDAYQRNSVPEKFTSKIMMVLRHIRDKMDVAVIRSVENTNNVLTDISDRKKAQIVRACRKTIEEYEYQPNSVTEIFEIE